MEKALSFFAVMAILLASCLDNPDCFQLNNHFVGVTFKKLSDNRSTVLDSVTVTETETDSAFITNGAVSRVAVRLNYFRDTTAYSFQISDDLYELVLAYKSQAQFVSIDCGERFVMTDLMVASHTFDSVRLVSGTPGFRNTVSNIEIFF